MGVVRQSSAHRTTVRSACSLAMALVEGHSVTAADFECRYRLDPAPEDAPRKQGARRAAFRNARTYLDGCGFVLEADPSRPGAVRLDREATLAPVDALAALDGEPELLEDLGHLLVALAGDFEGANAMEAHGAAAKLLRDFALSGIPRDVTPATTRDQRTIRDAMAGHHSIMVTYEREDGRVVQRVVEPLRHVNVQGCDFLVAADVRDGVVKTFHYDGVREARALEETFEPQDLDLENLFHPPFGYVGGDGDAAVPADVTFAVPGDRVAAVRAELARLLCGRCGVWQREGDSAGKTEDAAEGAGVEDGVGDTEGAYDIDSEAGRLLWTVHGESPARAAAFALAQGIEVLAPLPYRRAYLDAIAASRAALLRKGGGS